MEKLNSWQRLERKVGKGVMVQYRKRTPYEQIMSIGRDLAIKKRLEADKVGVPKYSKAEKKQIRKETERYFNSINNKYE